MEHVDIILANSILLVVVVPVCSLLWWYILMTITLEILVGYDKSFLLLEKLITWVFIYYLPKACSHKLAITIFNP